MSLANKVAVVSAGLDHEDLYFQKQEMEKIQQLRADAQKESDAKYRSDHQYHCFRCGTPSLVEVDHNGVKVDLCVNEGCGAVHLDPGELEGVIKAGAGALAKVQKALFSVFK
jgi:hypothetical protein